MGNAAAQSHKYSTCDDWSEPVEVKVNVYDLVNNDKLYKVGLGIHHSGIEIFGYEWSFGGGTNLDENVTGVFAIWPRTATPNMRTTVLLGTCAVTPELLDQCLKEMQREWTAMSYDLLTRNCNHFSEAFARRLGFTNFPGWVNRAAKMSSALIPKSLLHCVMQQLIPPTPEAEDQLEGAPAPNQIEEPPGAEEQMPIPDDLEGLTVRQLQTIMHVHHISWDQCVEREDLVAAIRCHQQK